MSKKVKSDGFYKIEIIPIPDPLVDDIRRDSPDRSDRKKAVLYYGEDGASAADSLLPEKEACCCGEEAS